MPIKNELPVPWNKWTKGGIVGILLGLICMQQVWLYQANQRIDKLQEQNAAWLNKFIDERIEKAKQEKFDPGIKEVKVLTDSVKTEIVKP